MREDLKIASFRTDRSEWERFCKKADSLGVSASDVLRAAMEQFTSGMYNPFSGREVGSALSKEEIEAMLDDVRGELYRAIYLSQQHLIDKYNLTAK